MIALAGLLLAVAIADLVAGGLQGDPASRRRSMIGIGAGAGSAALLAATLLPPAATAAVGLVGVVGIGGWHACRWSERVAVRGWGALAALAVTFGAAIAVGARWPGPPTPAADAWLASSPLPALAALDAAGWLFRLALFAVAAPTANAVVRAVLAAAGTKTRRSQRRLRGGRMIGVLERWLILGLMLHGEPTAAALVASAKSILRFPELSRVAREEGGDGSGADQVDHVTEYFLLGSLASWLVAIALALLAV